MPYQDIISNIKSEQQLQRQQAVQSKVIEQTREYNKSLEEANRNAAELQSKLNNLNPNTRAYDKVSKALANQVNYANSLRQQISFVESEIAKEARTQEQADNKRLKNLERIIAEEEKSYKFAKATVQEKLDISKEEIKSLQASVEKSKNLAQNKELSQEERNIAEAQLKVDEKRLKQAQDQFRITSTAQREVDKLGSYRDKILSTNKSFGEMPKEIKSYTQSQAELNIRKREGKISDEDYQAMSNAFKESLSPMTQQVVAAIEKGNGSEDATTISNKTLTTLNLISTGISALSNIVGAGFDTLNNGVDEATAVYIQNAAKISARLYGDSDNQTFTSIVDDIRKDVAASPFVSQKTLISNIAKLSEAGIDYNLEQRALLMTLNDKLVPTFDALDGTLTRMVRLQQADVTLSQMGSEAALTRILNNVFKDTSYLSDMYDSVSAAITDALSTQSDTDQYTQFGFAVQKWLGGLYSVGLSDSAVSSIASALNLLATGDINSLNGSSQQTLLAMSANKAGLSYANLLTEGMTATDVNNLMKSMIEYLRDIANNTSSNVVKSQWGDILNLEMSDWKAIQNVTDTDISNLYNAAVTQQSATEEINNIMTDIMPTRVHISEQVQTALDNAVFTFAMGIADDSSKYAGWKLISTIKSIGSSFMGDSTLINLLSGVASLAMFSEDLFSIPKNLASILLNGDQSIANIFSNYQLSMNRGGTTYDSSTTSDSNVSYGMSTSTSIDLTDVFGSAEEDDTYAGFSTDDLDSSITSSGNISTVSPGLDGSVHGGAGRKILTDSDVEELALQVGTTTADSMMTTFQQQDDLQSATAQNVMSQETVLSRDINDLYSELFEKQITPIRVALAKVEEQAQLDLHIEALDSIREKVYGTINVSGGSDYSSALSSMHSI